MSLSDPSGLKALGTTTKYLFDGPHAHLLEHFPSPFNGVFSDAPLKDCAIGIVKIRAPEFTSLCPLTGQPDFATIVIEYRPRLRCVESKALKLYLGSFRNAGEFHEACVARIVRDLVYLLDPDYLLIRGEFTPRGGIPFWPEVEYLRQDPDDAPMMVGVHDEGHGNDMPA